MPRHTPRTIWKPFHISALALLNDSTTPPFATFPVIRGVDADASMGLVLKRIDVLQSVGLTDTGTLTNFHIVNGVCGFFKWPSDAAAPSLSTIDLENRSSVISRTLWSVQGLTPTRFHVRMKSARLKLGETLFYFLMKSAESDSTILLQTAASEQHYETQA